MSTIKKRGVKMQVIWSLFISLTISFLSLVIFVMLTLKYFMDKNKSLRTHALTRLLAIVTLFIMVDSVYYTLFYASQYGYLPQVLYYRLSSPFIELVPKIGIFISVVFTIHFLMEKHIERFKSAEESLITLESMNKELDKKARDLESSQDNLQKKVLELEKFNEIAKSREESMLDLIKKIEVLENKLNKKK